MIGPRHLTQQQVDFNSRWAAPYGQRGPVRKVVSRLGRAARLKSLEARALGPFGFQPDNNATRIFEYAWAAQAVPVGPGQTVVDVGGSLGGLQFVLARQGAHVINVDPSESASMGWPLDLDTFAQLNKAFGTNVELRRSFLSDADLDDASVDTIYCISTIEHIPAEQISALMSEMYRILRPGGHVVLTVDLFYDLIPFTTRVANLHGTNINVAELVESSGMTLAQGNREELYGFAEFNPDAVLSNAQDHIQGHIALNTAQALVLKR